MRNLIFLSLILTATIASAAPYNPNRPLNSSTDSVTAVVSGVSTSALQTSGNSILSSISSKLDGTLATSVSNFPTSFQISNFPATQPVSGTVTATGPLTDTQLRANPVPVSFSGSPTVTIGNSSLAVTGTFWQATQPVSGTFWQATQPISAASLPLPAGAATGTKQDTGNASLATIDTSTAAINGKLPSLMSAAPGSDSGQSAIPVRVISQLGAGSGGGGSGFTGFSGSSSINNFGGSGTYTLNNSGGGVLIHLSGTWVGSLDVKVGSDILFTQYNAQIYKWDGTAVGAPVSTLTANGIYYVANAGYTQMKILPNSWTSGAVDIRVEATLATPLVRITSPYAADTKVALHDSSGSTVTVGQKTASASLPVTLASDQSAIPVSQPDLLITGAAAQTTLGNNALLASAGTTPVDVSGYRSASVQVVSTGTAGTYIFENSNDGTNFTTMTVYNSAIITGTPIVAAITATNSSLIYTFPIRARYIRLRIATAITGGSIQPFTRISQESWSPAVMQVAQATAGNLNVNATTALSAGTNAIGDVGVQYRANATGAALRNHIVCATTTNATSVKATAGRLLGFTAYNSGAAWRYLKFHNLATAPTVGTTPVVQTIGIPPGQYIDFNMEGGIAHTTGIAVSITTNAADTDTTVLAAADCGVDIIYQ